MKVLSVLLCFCLAFNYAALAQTAGLQGQIINPNSPLQPETFTPAHLRYVSYNQIEDNFNIIVDKGNFDKPDAKELENSAGPLMNYFFVGISLPSSSFWVNLRPDSPDKIIDPSLEKTDMGRVLLEADLQLKKDIALATSPQAPAGKEYWDRMYKKIDELFGNAEVSIPTLTRPWIVPDEVIVRETADSAYVYKATLKVMLEGDHLAGSQVYNFKDERLKKLNEYSTQLIKELVIPGLNKEINSAQRYTALRQVYYSLILSQWFKARFKGQGGSYASLIDKNDLKGLASEKPWQKSVYFNEYQKSFNEREYNLKESANAASGRNVKSYYSGGANFVTLADLFAPRAPYNTPELAAARGLRPQDMNLVTGTQAPQLYSPMEPPARPEVMPLPRPQAPPGMPQAPRAPALPPAAPRLPQGVGLLEAGRPGGLTTGTLVIPAGANPALNFEHYAQAPATGFRFVVTGIPGNDLRIARLAQSLAEQATPQEQRATRIQQDNNAIELVVQGRLRQQIPDLGLALETGGVQERSSRLRQALAADVAYQRRDRDPEAVFVPVEGLSAAMTALGAPGVTLISFGQYNVPAVYIDKKLVGNRPVENNALEKIGQFRTEARSRGMASVNDMGPWMKANPGNAVSLVARVSKQANKRFDVSQVVPGGNYGYGFTDLADATKGLPQRDIPLAVALQNLQVPEYMDIITEVGRRALGGVQRDTSSPARPLLLNLMRTPLAQQLLFLGTKQRVQQSPLVRTEGERVTAFAELLFQAKETLTKIPDLSPEERGVLNPAPLVSTTLRRTQTPSVSIPRNMWAPEVPPGAPEVPAAAALGQVSVEVPGFDNRVSLQVIRAPERTEGVQVVVLSEGERPIPLTPGKPVVVRAVPAAEAPGVLEAPGVVRPAGISRLATQLEEPAPATPGLGLDYKSTVPQAVARVILDRGGNLVVTNIAPEAPEAPEQISVDVTAFRSRQPATDLARVPSMTVPVRGLQPEAIPATALPVGGIDLRVLPIITQPLSNLSANLNKSTLRSLRNLDLDKEWAELERMIQVGMVPSAERIKENIQASCLQGEINLDIDRIVLDISKILKIEETRSVATEPALRDILVVLGAAGSPLEVSQVFLGKI